MSSAERLFSENPEIQAVEVGRKRRTLYQFEVNGERCHNYDLAKVVAALRRVKSGETISWSRVLQRPDG